MVARLIDPSFRAVDSNGVPIAGAKLNVFEAGTTTPINTFSDSALSSANANPVIASLTGNDTGIFPDMFVAADDYKVNYTDASDVQIDLWDNIEIPTAASFSGGVNSNGETEHLVKAETGTTYTVLDGDRGKIVTHTNASAIAVTLDQANSSTFENGWYYETTNLGVGLVTITPTISTIGGASTYTVGTNESVKIVSDGTNYKTLYRSGTGPGVLLDTKTASTSSTIVFDNFIDNTYSRYLVLIDGLRLSEAAIVYLTTSIDGGSTYLTSYDFHLQTLGNASASYSATVATAAAQISATATAAVPGSPQCHGQVILNDPGGATQNRLVSGHFSYLKTSNDAAGGRWWAQPTTSSAIDAIKFAPSAGTFTVGTFRLFGI